MFGRIQYIVHNLVTMPGLLTALVLWNSAAKWCDTIPFKKIVYKISVILHACV